jgi:hypothetical protein
VLCEQSDGAAGGDGRSGVQSHLSWSRLTVKALQVELRQRGLQVSGRKAELVGRLEAWTDSVPPSTGSRAIADEPTQATSPQTPPSPSPSPASRPFPPPPEPILSSTPPAAASRIKVPNNSPSRDETSSSTALMTEKVTSSSVLRTPTPRRSAADAASGAGSSVHRTPTPRRSAADPSAPVWRIASWNVAGLRGLLKGEHGAETLRRLVQEEGVGVIMLQASPRGLYGVHA